MSKYIGLDQALQTTGWAVYDDNTPLDFGHFTIPAHEHIGQRLGQFWKELNSLYEHYEFEYLFYEDIQRQQNVETYKKLAYVQAAILLWCFFNDVKCTALSPSQWRHILKEKFGVSFGKVRAEQKAAAKSFVKNKFHIEASEDECDAICLTLAGIQEKKKKTSAF